MILCTVGTNEAAFDRLVAAAGALADGEEVLIQRGASKLAPAGATIVEFLPYDELVAAMRRARVIVTHAGVGAVLTALSVGKRPLAVPRLAVHGEAVDDHQLWWGRRVAAAGLLQLVEHPADLRAATAMTHVAAPQRIAPHPALVAALRTDLLAAAR